MWQTLPHFYRLYYCAYLLCSLSRNRSLCLCFASVSLSFVFICGLLLFVRGDYDYCLLLVNTPHSPYCSASFPLSYLLVDYDNLVSVASKCCDISSFSHLCRLCSAHLISSPLQQHATNITVISRSLTVSLLLSKFPSTNVFHKISNVAKQKHMAEQRAVPTSG